MSNTRLATIVLIALSFVGPTEAQTYREAATPDEVARAQRALHEQGIQAAAALYGKYVTVGTSAPNGAAANVQTLAMRSQAIVVASVLSNVPAVSADGKGIRTEYRLRIDRAFMGPTALKSGDAIDVTLPGGHLVFPDGSSATMLLYDLELMESGRQYLLFLIPAHDDAPEMLAGQVGTLGRYTPTMGGQGIYELDGPNGTIKAMGTDSPVAYELVNLKSPAAALTRVQQAIDSLAKSGPAQRKP